MNTATNDNAERTAQTIQITDHSLIFRDIALSHESPTGAQLTAAAGFDSNQGASILEICANGELVDVCAEQAVNLRSSTRQFVVVIRDRLYRFSIAGVPYEWPSRIISGTQLRKIGHMPQDMVILQELPDAVERPIGDHDLVDLGAPGVERFSTRPRQWELNVQGVLLVVHHPTIVVREAIKDAGFDPTKPWIIVLRVRHQPKREVSLDDVIDLRTPGIEKLRLTPKEVNNGEGPTVPRRMFRLLDVDERWLDKLGLRWETIIEQCLPNQKRRWLLIHDYPLPDGYTSQHTVLALEIPLTYPGAQIDMFYTNPPLRLPSGRAIPNTEVNESIDGRSFNRWSRHRGQQSPWDPASDNVVTHLALVESAMLKEVDE
ncbi:multiubiquitin domain-containing protein [Burkholderia pyrrocinia]|uniref:multiubiquitin domain-containing protein n=1 Tax=Burkholderia pyrrocinia TaxID=60550 RepID=UPI002AB1A255|nr:multiubiquitin domain-containing protein [Burkholderia pyrrocinia]